MTQPPVTVCIPVYNGAKFIAAAVTSVLQQSYGDFELLISDNCSSDNTLEVVGGFSDPRIRIQRNERNLGMLGNFNSVTRAARGKYVKLLCADDVLYDNALQLQVGAISDPSNQGVVMVCSPRDIIDSNGRVLLRNCGLRKTRRLSADAAIKEVIRKATNPFGEPGSVLFRADAFAKTGGFSDRIPYLIDLVLWCDLLHHGDLYVLGKPVAAFRIARSSTSAAMAHRQASEVRQFLRELQKQDETISNMALNLACLKAELNTWARRLLYATCVR